MDSLAADPLVRFIGYGVTIGKAMGTLKNVASGQLIETPVAENLMVGMATGMSLAGLHPVVFIERMDFLMNAMDAIVNHLDKIETISRGEFLPAVIIRIVIGNKLKPLYTGETHTQDLSIGLRRMCNYIVVMSVPEDCEVKTAYDIGRNGFAKRYSTIICEKKDLI
jgi:pyruvate dehydrogenase E1 component beta subunit